MLAIARTLMGNPTTLLLDEPTEGSRRSSSTRSPRRCASSSATAWRCCFPNRTCVSPQQVADRAYVIEAAQLRYAGTMANFASDAAARSRYLGLA